MTTESPSSPEPSDPTKPAAENSPTDAPAKKGEATGTPTEPPLGETKATKKKSPAAKRKFKLKVDVEALKRAAEKALKRAMESRQQGDTLNFSSRIRGEGQAAYELIKAEHPELNNTDLLTYIMLLAAALIEAAPRPKFGSLDGEKYTLIKGTFGTLTTNLFKFEDQILEIEAFTDDPQRTEKIANLIGYTQFVLHRINTLAERLARLAMLPDIPKDPDALRRLEQLSAKLKDLEAVTSGQEKELWTLARKLLGPYLP